jgi:glycosyltransferase involved in cell wall biosynthesis
MSARSAVSGGTVTARRGGADASPRAYNILHTVRGLRVDGVVMVVLRNITNARSPEFRHHFCAMLPGGAMEAAYRSRGIEPLTVGHAGALTAPRSVRRLISLMRVRQIDLVHANRTLDLGLAGAAARVRGIPVVSSLHWLGRSEDHPEQDDTPRWTDAKRELTVIANRVLATKIIAVSAAVRESFSGLPGFPADRTVVVHPGLEMRPPISDASALARLRETLGLGQAHPVLLNIGRLVPVKGQRYLIPMMRRVRDRLPDAKLLIAGEGHLRATLEREIAGAGLSDAIVLLGSRSDVNDLLAVSDALVLSSESEAAPLPPMEAMRACRPVIATDVGGVREIVVDGVTGFVVPRGDAEALAGAVVKMFASPDVARQMGEAGRAVGLEQFDVAVSLERIEGIYRTLLDPARARRGVA